MQGSSYVRYEAIGTGFVTEGRFREAIDLLWQWPEGKELLRSANHSRVAVIAGTSGGSSYADYRKAFSLVTVNARFTEVSTWMLADIIAHELRHATDASAGLWQARTAANCYSNEQSAYATERRFLVWLSRTLHPEGLPNRYDLLALVSLADRELANNLYDIGTTGDLQGLVRRDYHESCNLRG